jgi:hypothetical protein
MPNEDDNKIFWYRFEPTPVNNNLERLKGLELNRLWISDPRDFNDPFDFNLQIEQGSDWQNNEQLYLQFISELMKNKSINFNNVLFPPPEELMEKLDCELDIATTLIGLIRDQISKFGVQCFSRNMYSALSWAHYASGSRGYAIKYLCKEFHLAVHNEGTFHFEYVTYLNTLPTFSLSECVFSPHETIKRILASKSLEWSYESEVRLIHYNAKSCKVDMPVGLSISELIIGSEASHETEYLVEQKAQQLGVPVKYAYFGDHGLQVGDRNDWLKRHTPIFNKIGFN